MSVNTDGLRPEGTPAGGQAEPPQQPADRAGEEGASIGERVGHNPANLGGDVPEAGDVTHPTPDPRAPEI